MRELGIPQSLLYETGSGLRKIFGDKLDSVLLYGSYARGDYNDESDVDIMAKLNMSADEIRSYRPRVSELASDIGLKYDILISIKLQDKSVFDRYLNVLPFYRNVNTDGVSIHV